MLGCTLLCAAVVGGAGIINANSVVDADSSHIMNLMCGEKAESIDAILSRIEQSVGTLAMYSMDGLDDIRRCCRIRRTSTSSPRASSRWP